MLSPSQERGSGDRARFHICKDCIHFFVTYDPHFPYGCRRMGFKSERHPHHEVLEASGETCQGREAKKSPGATTDAE